MKVWALIAALAVAGPAYAVPPVLPPGVQEFVQAFIHANTSNDLQAYASLFSPEAEIVSGAAAPVDKAHWIQANSEQFTPYRQTRFLDAFANGRMVDGRRLARVVFVEAVKACPPNRVECFPTYQTEAVTVRDGQIVNLERSEGLSRRFTPEGAWAPLE